MTIDSWIAHHASNQPDKPALIYDDQIISYDQMEAQITARLGLFEAHQIQAGDRVAFWGLNHPEVFFLLFACARIGALLVPLNWRLAPAELADILADCAPKLLIHDSQFEEHARALTPCTALHIADMPAPDNAMIAGQVAHVPKDAPLLIVYSSGSTGQPKGVVLGQNAIVANATMSIDAHQMTADDIVLNILPTFHVGGLNILPTPAFFLGATVILHKSVDVEACLEDCQRAHLIITVPTILGQMVAHQGWQQIKNSPLRTISIGSTDVPTSLIEAVHETGIPVIQIYGATETAPFAIYQHIDEAFDTIGSIGRQGIACEISIRDSDNMPVMHGKAGEICVKGDNILTGYWQNQPLTDASITDGWFHTGDVAYEDENGLFWFVDRIKHVIISGGENIYPAEIERILRTHPAIEEVAVVGRPDDRWGEVPVCVLVASEAVSPDALRLFLKDRLARYKQPHDYIFTDALPRNAMGKVVASTVRDIL